MHTKVRQMKYLFNTIGDGEYQVKKVKPSMVCVQAVLVNTLGLPGINPDFLMQNLDIYYLLCVLTEDYQDCS